MPLPDWRLRSRRLRRPPGARTGLIDSVAGTCTSTTDRLALGEPGHDAVQDVRPRELVLAGGQELAEEPGVEVLDDLRARRWVDADDVVARPRAARA